MTGLLEARFKKRFKGGSSIHCDWQKPVNQPSVTVLFGPSGCGKTTTLRCLAGLAQPDAGSIHYDGTVWFDATSKTQLPPQSRRVGFLFQDYALFPHLTVSRNIAYGLRQGSRETRNAQVEAMLELLRLQGLGDRFPHQLSGGQQQRVALARTIIVRPRLLLLDEPLSALDDRTRETIRLELRRLLLTLGIPVLLVTHDRVEAMALADHVIVLEDGKILQQGPVPDVFGHPADLATAAIVGVETVVPGKIVTIENGLATVVVGDVRLTAVAPREPTSFVSVCIRGEDVILQAKGAGETSSPRNRFDTKVVGWQAEGPLVRVQLDCGFPMTALVTRPAWEELGLREGDRVLALVKAPAIHLIARTGTVQ